MSAFFDTNILVYAFSSDPKQDRAENLIAGGGMISVQALNEFVNVLLRKQKQSWPVIDAAMNIVLGAFGPQVAMDLHLHHLAKSIAKTNQLGIYDALIVAAAIRAGRSILYSEDLNRGQQFDSVEIINPFQLGGV